MLIGVVYVCLCFDISVLIEAEVLLGNPVHSAHAD
jgi:hypothetical protein